jgi:FAD/FMN-containing dehydrogenase
VLAVSAEGWQAELEALLGREAVSFSEQELAWAAADAAGTYRLGSLAGRARLPLAVVRPDSTEAVAALVQWAGRRGVPLVPRGAGTGVMGGAVPLRPAVVVDLTRLRSVVVHAEDLVVEAGAGAVLADVDAALRPHGLMLGHDPWSVGMATVGGAIGTDGMGYLAGRWGSVGEQVAAVEAVLPDGSVLRTRPYKPPVGPRLAGLFAGSQGTLGIVTRAWLHAVPLPEAEGFVTFRFAGLEPGYAALLALWRTGLRWDLLDLTDAVPDWLDLPAGAEDRWGRTALLRLGAFGPAEEVAARLAVARRVLAAAGGQDLGPGPARAYWDRRHEVAERWAAGIHRPRDLEARRRAGRQGLDYLNLALPPSRVPDFRRYAMERVAAERDLVLHEVGIWCRPEVFSLLLAETREGTAGEDDPAPWPEGRHGERMAAVMEDLLRGALARGGSLECIHGAGLKLLPLLGEDLGAGLTVLRRVKAALDPQDLLNPGKWGEGEA